MKHSPYQSSRLRRVPDVMSPRLCADRPALRRKNRGDRHHKAATSTFATLLQNMMMPSYPSPWQALFPCTALRSITSHRRLRLRVLARQLLVHTTLHRLYTTKMHKGTLDGPARLLCLLRPPSPTLLTAVKEALHPHGAVVRPITCRNTASASAPTLSWLGFPFAFPNLGTRGGGNTARIASPMAAL
jgi:hypothetical protein